MQTKRVCSNVWRATISIILLLGCKDNDADRVDSAEGSTDVVTFEEYESAVFAFRDCVREAGHDLEGLRRTKRAVLDVYEYIVPGPAVEDGTDERCYLAHLQQVDLAWVSSLAAYYRDHPEAEPGFQSAKDCAMANDIPLPDEATMQMIVEALRVAGIDFVTQCP